MLRFCKGLLRIKAKQALQSVLTIQAQRSVVSRAAVKELCGCGAREI